LHFGHRVTSRVEGSHSLLEGYLQVSTGDLKLVLENIERLLISQHTDLEATLGSAKLCPGHDLQIPLFSDVLGRVAPYVLHKILEQSWILESSGFNPRCTRLFTSSLSLPCTHKLKELKENGEALQLVHIHQHWYFTHPIRPLVIEPLLRNPLVAVTRGRPAASESRPPTVPSTAATTAQVMLRQTEAVRSNRRNPSRFELEQTLLPSRRSTRIAQEKEMEASNSPVKGKKRWKRGDPIPSDDDGHDSEEDRLVEVELQRLRESRGDVAPLWSTMPEFEGMTRATKAYSLRPRGNQSGEGSCG
jgi:hypothetical protein